MITFKATGCQVIYLDEKAFKMLTYYNGKYNPERCGVEVQDVKITIAKKKANDQKP